MNRLCCEVVSDLAVGTKVARWKTHSVISETSLPNMAIFIARPSSNLTWTPVLIVTSELNVNSNSRVITTPTS